MYYSTQKSSYRSSRQRLSRSNGSRFGRKQQSIDPSLLVKKAVVQPEDTAVYQPKHAFSDFIISDQLKQNISAKGYKNPTPIQDQAIPHLLAGKDVVGIANTGTGKTAAFLIPLINKVFFYRAQKVLIIAPTRELAVQIEDEFRAFARGMNILSVLCIGGVSLGNQIHALRRNPHFVIGTPGRLKDLEKQGKLNFANFTTIVLDEVDRMLDMGFIHDVNYIISRFPRTRHSLFFSATLPQSVQEIMRGFLKDPVTISVKSQETAENVEQDVIRTNGRAKIDILYELLQKEEFEKVLVFGRTKWSMEKLSKALIQKGLTAAAIHGNKNQNQRQKALDAFKANKIQVLLATDIASRGLDIDDVSHVINYDLPASYEDYIHRIGRTGRADKKGIALSFVE